MYYKISDNGLNLREYFYHTRAISIKDSPFEVVGTMGTSHKFKARIIVRPLGLRDLTDNLRRRFGNGTLRF